jgi:hypothetical protein
VFLDAFPYSGLCELRLSHEPVADRRNGGEQSRATHYAKAHRPENMLDHVIVGSLAPEGMDVGVYDAEDEAEHRSLERELFRIPRHCRSKRDVR